MTKEYIIKLNEMVCNLESQIRRIGNVDITNLLSSVNQLKGYLSALETLNK